MAKLHVIGAFNAHTKPIICTHTYTTHVLMYNVTPNRANYLTGKTDYHFMSEKGN